MLITKSSIKLSAPKTTDLLYAKTYVQSQASFVWDQWYIDSESGKWSGNPSEFWKGLDQVRPSYEPFTMTRDISSPVTLDYKSYINEPGWRTVVKVPIVEYRPSKIDLGKYLALPQKPVLRLKKMKGLLPVLDLKLKPRVIKPPSGSVASRSKWTKFILPRLEQRRAEFERRVIKSRTAKYKKKLASYKLREQRIALANINLAKAFELKLKKWQARADLVSRRRSKVENWKARGRFKKTYKYGRPKKVNHPFTKIQIVNLDEATPLVVGASYDGANYVRQRASYEPYDWLPASNHNIHTTWYTQYGPLYNFLPDDSPAVVTQKVKQCCENTVIALTKHLRSEIGDLDAKITRKLYEKLNNQKVHIGNMLGERAQTYELLTSSVKRLASLIGAKKHLFQRLGKYIKSPKAIANDYLAFKFGVEPLVSDIDGLLQVLANSELPDQPSIVVRSNSQMLISKDIGDLKINGRLKISYVLEYRTTNQIAHSLQSLGLVNPAEIAWEVMPWSFVIDWFLPIGSYIQALNADTGLNFVSGTRTVRFNGTIDSRPTTTHSANPFGSLSVHPGEEAWVQFLNSYPDPTYQISAPTGYFAVNSQKREVLKEPPDRFMILIKNPMSVTHGLLSLSLLIQKIFKR